MKPVLKVIPDLGPKSVAYRQTDTMRNLVHLRMRLRVDHEIATELPYVLKHSTPVRGDFGPEPLHGKFSGEDHGTTGPHHGHHTYATPASVEDRQTGVHHVLLRYLKSSSGAECQCGNDATIRTTPMMHDHAL